MGSVPQAGQQFGHHVLNASDSAKRKGAVPGDLYFTVAQNKGCSERERHASSWAACALKTQEFFSMTVHMF